MLFAKKQRKELLNIPNKKFLRKYSLRIMSVLQSPNTRADPWQKAFFGTLRKGVLTVELAFVLPLFLMGTLTLIGFMDVMRVQTEKISRLCEKAMEMGVYAYVAGERVPVIEIPEIYTYRLPVSIVPLLPMVITNRAGCTAGREWMTEQHWNMKRRWFIWQLLEMFIMIIPGAVIWICLFLRLQAEKQSI